MRIRLVPLNESKIEQVDKPLTYSNINKLVKDGYTHFKVKDKYGEYELSVLQVNKDNIKGITDKLHDDLIRDGKYDSWYTGISTNGKFDMQMLPIYGSKDGYVTRHFIVDQQQSIKSGVADLVRGRGKGSTILSAW